MRQGFRAPRAHHMCVCRTVGAGQEAARAGLWLAEARKPASRRRCCRHASALPDGTALTPLVLAQVTGSPVPLVLGSLLGAGLFVLGLRAWCYAQVEYVTAAMLSRNVPRKPLKIVQLGGGTRELFYYPRETIQVTAIGDDLNTSLMGQAGIQAAVPVVCRKEAVSSVTQLAGSSADVIVSLSSLHLVGDLRNFFASVQRVLSPGGRFIFVQPVSSGGASPIQGVAGTAARTVPYDAFASLKALPGFSTVEWDVANEAVDPHVVGIAIKAAVSTPQAQTAKGKSRRA